MCLNPQCCVQEQKRELKRFGRQFVNDPLQPVRNYFSNYVLPGMGLFLEGYVVFSISNNTTMFQQTYTSCWSTFKDCNEVDSLSWPSARLYLMSCIGL